MTKYVPTSASKFRTKPGTPSEKLADEFKRIQAGIGEGPIIKPIPIGDIQYITDTPEAIVFSKSIQTPGQSIYVSGNTRISSANDGLSLYNKSKGLVSIFTGQIISAAGSQKPFDLNASSAENVIFQNNNSETAPSTDVTTSHTVTENSILYSITVYPAETGNINIKILNGTNNIEIAEIEGEITTPDQETAIALENNAGEPTPLIFYANDPIKIITSGILLKGVIVGSTFAPYWAVNRSPFTLKSLADDADVEAKIGSNVKGGAGIDVSYNPATGDTTITSTALLAPGVSEFNIDIPARVDLNTDLNVQKTVNYRLADHADITSLKLQVDNVDNVNLAIPSADGLNSEQVSLTGIDTSTQKTIDFRIQANGSVNSNTQRVTVRNLGTHEYIYYGLSSTNNPATIDISTVGKVEAVIGDNTVSTQTASQQSDFFIILVPSSYSSVTITDTVFQQDVTNIFTKTSTVRQINSEDYDSYVLGPLNAGVNESYIFEVVV